METFIIFNPLLVTKIGCFRFHGNNNKKTVWRGGGGLISAFWCLIHLLQSSALAQGLQIPHRPDYTCCVQLCQAFIFHKHSARIHSDEVWFEYFTAHQCYTEFKVALFISLLRYNTLFRIVNKTLKQFASAINTAEVY